MSLALLVVLLALAVVPLTAQPADLGWLNVREFGASGSAFETTAVLTAGSAAIEVKEVGDFQVGQQVMVSRANVRWAEGRVMGPGNPYGSGKKLEGHAEFRGYDGAAGSWLVLLLEIDGAEPLTFRFSDDLARTWKQTKVPVTFDWQPLSQGVEVRLARQEWQPGHLIGVSARDQLVATIQKIEGTMLTLNVPANQTVTDAVVRHCDSAALQTAVDQAIAQKRNLHFPAGYYRLATGLLVRNAALTLEGVAAEHVVLDLSEGTGGVFALYGGREVTLRNFTLLGHTGAAERAGSFRTSSGFGYWACSLKSCSGVQIFGTERVLCENVHARRMASEAFYSQGPFRQGAKEPEQFTRAITYLRCSVLDCAANAFNNNDAAENTSVLHCRIESAGAGGWHAWEGPSRFIRFQSNYVRNAGPVTIGDMSHRYPHLNELGCGQAIVTDNVFEGTSAAGGIVINHGASQVVVANNLFVNYNGNAIRASAYTVRTSYPSRQVVIRGNLIDLTYDGPDELNRTGIYVSVDGATVSDNQVYVRHGIDPKVEGIRIMEPALNVSVRGNQVSGCGRGLVTGRAGSKVTQVIDSTTFLEDGLPLQWEVSHRYRGWQLLWLSGDQAGQTATIDSFDPDSLQFKLTAPSAMKPGDPFHIFWPGGANWLLRDNTITSCQTPVVLDSYGSPSSVFSGNLLERGAASGVKEAITLAGRFAVEHNRLVGFNEPDCEPIRLGEDKLARDLRAGVRGNEVE
ncbi:MAG: right-handed parallel beta-helix repeat-containing protein [Armatimonadetes bacterium]|nr:right-handed parallel beta-helix repeat-containing protein [Armatimonadota bacterium]